jgi:hypothetical protein
MPKSSFEPPINSRDQLIQPSPPPPANVRISRIIFP